MKYLTLVGLLFIVSTSLDCTNGQTYVKFRKQNKNFADEESFVLKNGATAVYTSPLLVSGQMYEVEQCVTSTTNNQYTLELKDSYGDGWSAGAYIEILGEYGNVFFKTMPLENQIETHTLSLYYAIKKAQEWKTTTNASGTWTEYNFADSAWTSVTLGTVRTVTGAQYFRKTFTGLANMAAYDAMFNYRAGIIAYVNGVEIYRDNMPEGPATATTVAAGVYPQYAYRGCIRPAFEVGNAQSVLAVEVHFLDTTTANSDEFDAYVALRAPSLLNSSCAVFLESSMTYTTTPSVDEPIKMFDMDYISFVFGSSTSITIDLTFGNVVPYLNGLEFWPYNNINYAPSDFTFSGKNLGTTYNNVISVSDLLYTASSSSFVYAHFDAALYKNYRLAITSAVSASQLYLYEVHPLVCNISPPTSITFEPNNLSVYAGYDIINVEPTESVFSSCTINPALPEGVTLDDDACTITGFAKVVTPSTVYTITGMVGTHSLTGTVTLEFKACSGQIVDFYRTYRENAAWEYFEVVNDVDDSIVYAEAAGSSQVNLNNIHHFLCLTGNSYTVNLHSTTTWWQQLSWLYVRGMFEFVAPQSSSNQYENIIRAKFDSDMGLPSSYSFTVNYVIPHSQNWYYKMGELPANWYDSSTAGWTEKPSTGYPSSTNQIQLYKKIFTVTDVSGAAVVVNIRHKYGCVVYLNGHEAFRSSVSGTLSMSSHSSLMYTSPRYRQYSVPLKTFAVEGSPSVEYIKSGSNTIAIALVSISDSMTESVFDCAVRVMGKPNQSRYLNDFSITGSGISGSTISYFAFWTYSNYYSSSTCTDNYINIQFSYDRREWISSIGVQLINTQTDEYPRQFVLKGKNSEESDWTVLKTVTGMTWSMPGQLRKIFITNNKAYNQYRFENIGTGIPGACAWKLNRIDLMADAHVAVPDLAYETTSFSIYKDVEMAEVYPTNELYMDFTVNPPLPTGVTIDPNSGTISGTAHVESPVTTYTVSAKKFTGEATSATISFGVEVCTGGRSLITLVVRTDSYPEESSYKLFHGKGTTGSPIEQNTEFAVGNALNYADFCLNHDLYTVQLVDSYGDGWNNPAGYYLSVDLGSLKFEMGQVVGSNVSTMFSSYLPFQYEYDDWKIHKETVSVPANWNAVDFDDNAWTTGKLEQIGNTEAITVYARRTFTLPNIEDYHVLNVHIKYAGGVVAYFNGRKVARFNIDEHCDDQTESLALHDINTDSKFHIILNTVGVNTAKNVMAFEIHRPLGQSSAQPVFFDATGVFGVNDCSIVVDTFLNIEGSQPSGSVTLADLFDLTPVSFGYLPNSVGSYIQWEVENLEGSKFNSYAWQTAYETTATWGLSLYARLNSEEEYVSAMEAINQAPADRARKAWPAPVGIASFKQFKYVTDATTSTSIAFSAHFFQYCKPSGTNICPGIDDYPPVGQGEISPSSCEYGFSGYSYRECQGTTLGEIKTDKCSYKEPSGLYYESRRYIFIIGVENNSGVPHYNNVITNFRLHEGSVLPNGLILDATTGAIRGVPTDVSNTKTYTIYGENPKAATQTVVNISVRKGECKADGNFQRMDVGEVAEYDCAMQGAYLGTQKRACVLGTKDGEWQEVEGMCVSITLLVILIVVVVVIVVVVALFVMKATKKGAKAVGGTKKGTKAAPKKTMEKKTAAKSVKV